MDIKTIYHKYYHAEKITDEELDFFIQTVKPIVDMLQDIFEVSPHLVIGHGCAITSANLNNILRDFEGYKNSRTGKF